MEGALKDNGLPTDFLGGAEGAAALCVTATAELSPVCAILGGILGQEVSRIALWEWGGNVLLMVNNAHDYKIILLRSMVAKLSTVQTSLSLAVCIPGVLRRTDHCRFFFFFFSQKFFSFARTNETSGYVVR